MNGLVIQREVADPVIPWTLPAQRSQPLISSVGLSPIAGCACWSACVTGSGLVTISLEPKRRTAIGFADSSSITSAGVTRAKRGRRLPVVLSPDEVRTILLRMRGIPRLCAVLMYGSGLRLLECLSLRVKDVDAGAQRVARAPLRPVR